MNMTNNEIRREYRLAKDKKEQIKILADLNLCSKSEIVFTILDSIDAEIAPLEKEYRETAGFILKGKI